MRRNAFTILELVFTMTAIALLAMLIVYGKKLRESSDLAGTMRQYTKFSSYITTFRDRYNNFPGDFAEAYDYWPSACSSAELCNGDGDEKIEAGQESLLVWLHLSQADLLGGVFTGAGDDISQVGGVNVPKAKLYPNQFSAIYYEGSEFTNNKHYLIIGAAKSEDLSLANGLKPNDAYAIDEKFDDKLPGQGIVLGRNGYQNGDYDNSSCLIDPDNSSHISNNAENIADAIYNGDSDLLECFIAIRFY